ncbi:MAG: DUF4296 domain-containing protein [Syntrophothermus sp.]
MKRIIPVVFLLLFAASSCSDKNVITDKEKFAAIYVDLQLNIEKNRNDQQYLKKGMDSVLAKYSITSEQYYKTIEYYGQDKEQWDELFSVISQRLSSMKKQG